MRQLIASEWRTQQEIVLRRWQSGFLQERNGPIVIEIGSLGPLIELSDESLGMIDLNRFSSKKLSQLLCGDQNATMSTHFHTTNFKTTAKQMITRVEKWLALEKLHLSIEYSSMNSQNNLTMSSRNEAHLDYLWLKYDDRTKVWAIRKLWVH